MSFLEAHRVQASFAGGPSLNFLFAISGAADKLGVFFQAAGAKRGRSAKVRTLPFNTLGQELLSASRPGETEVFLLFPWDFVPEADWRSGFPAVAPAIGDLHDRAENFALKIRGRPAARVLYVPAPLPPVFPNPTDTVNLTVWLATLATSLGAELLPPEVFSLGSYLSTGTPFAGTRLGEIAERVIDRAMGTQSECAKVLVTDLDNVLWHGVIGEDGVEGIRHQPEGVGYRHFLYQSLLAKLKREGALLAAVSRNDADLATAPFRTGEMTLGLDDFVVVVASYNPKSSQIREIATQLNLGLDSFVFVDDNPIELEEVSSALPQVKALAFPAKDDELPTFFAELASSFARPVVTAEDVERTEMYRRRLKGMLPQSREGADLTGFLRGLEMSMIVHDRSQGDRARAVQLINKTNQFNLNGRRFTDEEVAEILAAGGRLFTASLTDRTGSHGEVLACLLDADCVVRSLVMSCRVFQRRLEYAFLCWLAGRETTPTSMEFAPTPRNEPFRVFLDDPSFTAVKTGGMIGLNITAFREGHREDLGLFAISAPSVPPTAGTPGHLR
jgi:FkbH-like protein